MPEPDRGAWTADGGSYSPRCQCPIATSAWLPEPGIAPAEDALLWLSHDDAGVREAAVVAMSRRHSSAPGWRFGGGPAALPDDEVTRRLAELTHDDENRVAEAARRALRGEEPWEEPPLLRAVPAPARVLALDLGSRLAAARWACRCFEEEAQRQDLLEVARRDEAYRRFRASMAAAEWLAGEDRRRSLEDREAADAAFRAGPGEPALALAEGIVIRLLGDPACLVRGRVLEALWRPVGGNPVPGVVTALERAAESEPCDAARLHLCLALAASPDSSLRLDAAHELLRHPDPAARRWLALVPPPEVVPTLLGDPDLQVRCAALRAMSPDQLDGAVPWCEGLDVVTDRQLDADAVVREFEALWSPVVPHDDGSSYDPDGQWGDWPQTWRSDPDLGGPRIVESWLIDLVGHAGTSPRRRFSVLEELLADFEGTSRYAALLGTAGNALVAEAADADWFPEVWEPWLRVVALLPAWGGVADERVVVGDRWIVERLCWSPPRALPASEHVEFWRRSGGILWRAGSQSQPSRHADPLWRSRLTSLGLTAELLLDDDRVPDELRPAVGRVALYAPDGPLAVISDVPRRPQPGDAAPPASSIS